MCVLVHPLCQPGKVDFRVLARVHMLLESNACEEPSDTPGSAVAWNSPKLDKEALGQKEKTKPAYQALLTEGVAYSREDPKQADLPAS